MTVRTLLHTERDVRAFYIPADLVFKNQAIGDKDRQGQFVNDLLRTEFHK